MSDRQTSRTRKLAGKTDSKTLSTIALVGLVAMGFGKASHLVTIGYRVVGLSVYEPTHQRFIEAGGKIEQSPLDAARGSDFFSFIWLSIRRTQVRSYLILKRVQLEVYAPLSNLYFHYPGKVSHPNISPSFRI